MSRHEIQAFDPVNTVIVGWDPPLQTFFAQVKSSLLEKTDPDDPFLLWVGCSLREIDSVDGLVAALRGFANIDAEICKTLYDDKDEGR
ncbi:hypothetical protein ACVWXN_003434 [Bradyrhizobium sp. i1.4.4]